MFEAFLTVSQQVLLLFFFLSIGFVLGKAKLLDDISSRGLSNLVLYSVVPAMLIVSFQGELDKEKVSMFFVVIGLTVALHVVHIIAANLLLKESDPRRCGMMRFATVFPNCGFMGYPLMSALVGSVGVLYGSAYVATSIFLVWTAGVYMVTGNKKEFSLRKATLNPGVLGVVIAMVLYLTQVKLPPLLLSGLTSLSALNTPLPMIVIGYQLSQAKFGNLFVHRGFWLSSLLRLIVLPAISAAVAMLLPIPKEVIIVFVIASATPPAAITGMFAARFGNDTDFASGLTAVQTAFSIVTIPVIVGIVQFLIA